MLRCLLNLYAKPLHFAVSKSLYMSTRVLCNLNYKSHDETIICTRVISQKISDKQNTSETYEEVSSFPITGEKEIPGKTFSSRCCNK